ncbi:hypothetical protein [Brytella acorum]|uniref:Uncharacterized protein n=1 Tax=Brytella acorum TaxID=2959299 RepID=A0AA35UYD8_9PROT|nr:hypothetical protein [Brytella acorum]CAI9121869.1 hypothetical protein LMG32879_002724 [Brytella acorum]
MNKKEEKYQNNRVLMQKISEFKKNYPDYKHLSYDDIIEVMEDLGDL